MAARFEEHEFMAYFGDFADDYDIDAIRDEVTERDYRTGDLVWRDEYDEETDDDAAWNFEEVVRRHDVSAAWANQRHRHAFRAARETLGLTQSRMADVLGITVRSVKRWESSDDREVVPEELWRCVELMLRSQDALVASIVDEIERESDDRTPAASFVVLPYVSTHREYDEVGDMRDYGDTWTQADATLRRVAEHVRLSLGMEVRWASPYLVPKPRVVGSC